MKRPLSLKDIAIFFLPLAFTAELMMISHTIIHAALARMGQPTESLAAFSIAFSVHATLSSPSVIAPITGLAFLRNRASLSRLLRFHGVMMLVPMGVAFLFAFTALGDWVFGGWLGASPFVISQARTSLLILAFVHPIINVRAISHALLMLNRRTWPITSGTFVRVVALVGFLAIVPRWLAGAPAGALSLVFCIGVETCFMFAVTRREWRELPEEGDAIAYPEMWGFSWPLMIGQLTEGSLAFVMNIFIGRLARPDLALAAYGVVRGLAMLLLSPLRNMAQTGQTMGHSQAEVAVLLRFTLIAVVTATGIVFVLFWTPLRGVILDGVMGLPPDVSAYSGMGVRMMVVVPLAWGYAALFRGLLSALRRTRVIGLSAAFKLAAMVAVGAWSLWQPDSNGTVLGMLALAAAFCSESIFLGWRLFLGRRS